MHLLLKFCLGCSFVVGCCAVPADPGGDPDCLSVVCIATNCINPYTPPNQCCPICRSKPVSGCIVNGVQYSEGATVNELALAGPCQVCTCLNRAVQCNIMSCAACDGEIPPGQCCPSCNGGPIFGP
ncbi:hypothetical protein DPMN_172694 [Dreissena polymorpha]|uniref:VWFC domain-containing protein n=1 Tax=Dreissena polymorpha TaxID=45954 RepID=A0A9D4IGV2_DREPO|nr:hypothetical protein DPMN_172694 [Dreissena polymorpha]